MLRELVWMSSSQSSPCSWPHANLATFLSPASLPVIFPGLHLSIMSYYYENVEKEIRWRFVLLNMRLFFLTIVSLSFLFLYFMMSYQISYCDLHSSLWYPHRLAISFHILCAYRHMIKICSMSSLSLRHNGHTFSPHHLLFWKLSHAIISCHQKMIITGGALILHNDKANSLYIPEELSIL